MGRQECCTDPNTGTPSGKRPQKCFKLPNLFYGQVRSTKAKDLAHINKMKEIIFFIKHMILEIKSMPFMQKGGMVS